MKTPFFFSFPVYPSHPFVLFVYLFPVLPKEGEMVGVKTSIRESSWVTGKMMVKLYRS